MKEPVNILIVKYGALGDVVRTSFFAKPIKMAREGTPGHVRLYWLTSPLSAPLLRFNPYIDVITSDPSQLSAIRFDTVYSLDDERKILDEVNNLQTRRIVGAFLSSDGTSSYCEQSAIWFDMGLLSKLGKERADELKLLNTQTHSEIFAKIFEVSEVDFNFYNSPFLADSATLGDEQGSSIAIGINAFAGPRWPSKALMIHEVDQLVATLSVMQLKGLPVKIYLLGSGLDRERNKGIRNKFPFLDNITVVNTDRNVLDLANFISGLSLIITSDSLALHLAVAQNVPIVSFFAPTSSAEIESRDNIVKLRSNSLDYCSYRPNSDNSSITARRIVSAVHDLVSAGFIRTRHILQGVP